MKNLLIIGGGDAGKMVIGEMLENERIRSRYQLVGILDDDAHKKNILGFPVLGRLSDAPALIKQHAIEEVIIAIPSAERAVVNKILASLANTGVAIKIVPGLYEIIEGSVSFNQIRAIEPADLLGREEVGFNLETVAPHYEGKTVFVTGAGGSIGSEIIRQLFELPVKKVVAFGHGENSIHGLIQKYRSDKRFHYIIGDVRDHAKLEYEMGRHNPEIVFHAAAHKHVPLMEDYPEEAVKNNIFGTYNTVMAAIHHSAEQFILVSTDKAVNPTSVMGASKRIAEKIVYSLHEGHATRTSFVRFGNVLGSRGSVIPIFQSQIVAGGPLTVTHPEMERYFMSIREAARLVIKSATVKEGSVFVLDMGKPVKIVELAKAMIALSGFSEDEIPIEFTGLRPGEKLYEEVLTASEALSKSGYDKLFISGQPEEALDENELMLLLAEFKSAADNFDNAHIRSLIKRYVPEYLGGNNG